MLKAEIEPGQEYVFREERRVNKPIQHVKIIEYIRGKKWKAEWIDPNPGLVDYIESQQLIVRWRDRKAFLRDEENAQQLRENNKKLNYQEDSPYTNVLYQVYESFGEKDLSYFRGILSGKPDAIDRIKQRAKIDPEKKSEISYIDRFGEMHLPYAEALEIAKAFCIAEPETVLMNVESTEREWTHDAAKPGNEYMLSLINEYRAAWALIRQWAGYDAAIYQKEAQIQRYERLVMDAIYALQKAGIDDEANRLRRAMKRK